MRTQTMKTTMPTTAATASMPTTASAKRVGIHPFAAKVEELYASPVRHILTLLYPQLSYWDIKSIGEVSREWRLSMELVLLCDTGDTSDNGRGEGRRDWRRDEEGRNLVKHIALFINQPLQALAILRKASHTHVLEFLTRATYIVSEIIRWTDYGSRADTDTHPTPLTDYNVCLLGCMERLMEKRTGTRKEKLSDVSYHIDFPFWMLMNHSTGISDTYSRIANIVLGFGAVTMQTLTQLVQCDPSVSHMESVYFYFIEKLARAFSSTYRSERQWALTGIESILRCCPAIMAEFTAYVHSSSRYTDLWDQSDGRTGDRMSHQAKAHSKNISRVISAISCTGYTSPLDQSNFSIGRMRQIYNEWKSLWGEEVLDVPTILPQIQVTTSRSSKSKRYQFQSYRRHGYSRETTRW
jgi:hypothetical protein